MTNQPLRSGEMGCSDSLTVESQFIDQGKENIVAKFYTIYRPNAARIGVRSLVDPIYWRKLLNNFCVFVEHQ